MKHVYLLRLALLFAICSLAPTLHALPNTLNAVFIDNRGQVTNTDGGPVADVLFYAQTQGMDLFITPGGYSIVTHQNEGTGLRYNRVDFTFANMHLQKEQVVFTQGNHPYLNFYAGAVKREKVQTSDLIIIRNAYPGIDWLWRFDASGKPKYEFAVNYGADASQIKYTVTGANTTQKENFLEYANTYMRVKEGPVTLQQLNDNYSDALNVQGNVVSYRIPEKLKEGGFTIDPPLELIWSYGIDTLQTTFRRVVKDSAYNTITTGFSADYNLPAFPQVSGSFVSPTARHRDAVIMKTDMLQNLIWCTFFGGANNDEGNAITTTPNGIFITGYSESWNFPIATAGNFNQLVSLNGRDAFIAKFDNQGRWQWSTGYGGSESDEGMDVDYQNGKIYVAGYTNSSNFPVLAKAGAYNNALSFGADADAFILEFDTACYRQWGTRFGSRGNDYFTSLYVDTTGIYTSGFSVITDTSNIPLITNGSAYLQPTHDKAEVIVQKFNLNDSLVWSTYFGAEESDFASSIERNTQGLFICGKTNSADLPVQDQLNGNYFQDINNGGYDGFIARFDPNTLQKKYCTYYGTGGDDGISDLATDQYENTVFTGFTNSTVNVVNNLNEYFHQDASAGMYDGIILGFDTLQRLYWATNFGTDGNDWGHGVVCILPCITDVVGEGLYNYSQARIGGTYLSSGCTGYLCTKYSSNGVSNRFLSYSCVLSGGGFPGGGGSCPYALNFQALIPLKNTCPDQCNGRAMIDTANIGGCPPYQLVWSNGDIGLVDSSLCENYWSEITDAAGQHRKLYGRFNVLRVSSPANVYTSCEDTADWASIIHIEGGGPPYTLEFRGTSTSDCPTTAFFAIHDTAGCVVSHSIEWYRQNRNIPGYFHKELYCQLWLTADLYNGQCVNTNNTAGWQYIIISGTDTLRKPFINTPAGIFALIPEIGKTYYGYLDIGDCISFLDSFQLYDSIQYETQITRACHGNDGTISVTVQPDIAQLQQTFSYSLQFDAYDSINHNSYNENIFFNTAQPETQVLDNLPPSVYYVNLHYGDCDSTKFRVDLRSFTYDINEPTVFCGHPDSLITTLTFGTPPLTYEWQATWPDTSIYEIGIGLSAIVIDRPGTYTLTISDTNNCQKTDVLDIDGSYKVHIDSIQENLTPCNGADLATTAAVYFSEGNAPYTILWSSGEQNFIAGNITDSLAWVIVTDRDNCRDSVSFLNTKQLEIVIADSVSDLRCYASGDGAILLTISEGYAPYAVDWSDGGIDAERTYLAEGPYQYTVTDSRGCTKLGSAVIHSPDSISVTYTTTAAHCIGYDGTASVTATGGTGQLTIAWQDGSSDFYRSDLPAGPNYFAVIDENGCDAGVSINIDTLNDLAITITKQDISCFGANDGYLEASATGGQGQIFYTWSSGDVGPSISSPAVGFYEVSAIDNAGCTVTDTASIIEPEEFGFTVDTNGGVYCHDDYAYITFYPYGGTAPYYNADYTYLQSGDYTWTITDDHGCSASQNISLANPEALVFSAYVFRQPDCLNPDGVITAIASGGRPGYALYLDYVFQGNFTDSLQINASPGPHDLQIWDNYDYGCYASVHVDVDTTGITNGYALTHNPTCNGYNNGSIQLNMTGGTPPFVVNGNSFNSTYTFNNLAPGNYTYTVFDLAGCQHTFNQTLIQPAVLAATVDTGIGIPCGGQLIDVQINATGGTLPYTGAGIFQQGAGNYNITVTDSNNCAVQLQYSLSEPIPLATTISIVAQPSCINPYGAIQLFTTGGHAPYNSGFLSYPLYHDSISIGGLSAGNTTILITDSTGCTWSDVVYINSYESLQFNITKHNPACHAETTGSVDIDVTQGTGPFMIDGNYFLSSYTISNLDSGAYSYIITDSANCPYQLQFLLDDPEPLVADYNITQPITCNGNTGNVFIYASGGTPPYNGTGAHTDTAGSYQVPVVDLNGCNTTVNYQLTEPDPITTLITVTQQPSCLSATGSLDILTFGGVAPYHTLSPLYSSYSSSVSLTSLPSGNLSVTLIDSFGCNWSGQAYINPYQPTSATVTTQSPVCHNGNTGSAEIDVSQGTGPFSINGINFDSAIIISNLSSGAYNYNITDSAGCNYPIQFSISNPAALQAGYQVLQPIACSGTQATVAITATGGLPPYSGTGTYQFNAGSYLYSVSDSNGCSAQVNFNLSDPMPFSVDTAVIQPTCTNSLGTLTLNPFGGQGPYFVQTANGTVSFTTTTDLYLPTGNYTLPVRDTLGCQVQVYVVMEQLNNVFANATAYNLNCYNDQSGAISISAFNGQAPYTIDGIPFNDSALFNNLTAGTYTYIVTDDKGCTRTVSATVSQPLPLIIDSVHTVAFISCSQTNDAVVEIYAEGGSAPYTYGINGPVSGTQLSSYFSNLSAGTYTASIVDNKGCSAVTGFEVPAFTPRTFDVQVDTVTCHGGSNGAIRIYPQPADANQFMFSLDGGPPQVYNVFYDLPAGSYNINITDNHNCNYSVQAIVSQPDSFDARVWLNGLLLPQDSSLLDERQFAEFVKVSTHPWEVSFSPSQTPLVYSDTLVKIQPRETISYNVVVYKDSVGGDCYIAYKGVIAVHPVAAIPNMVTPNGDGFNDQWEIDLDKFPNAQVTIFDRWGEIVYESQNYANDWAGTFKNTGRKVADGTYFYILKVPSQNNKVYKGDINILNSTN